jgi:glutamate/tyrosine decarboxylase-like PLP-dependent enzyme
MIDPTELQLLRDALDRLAEGFSDLPDFEPEINANAVASVLQEVAARMHDNYPYYHPQYAGQMLKPPHPIARIAYAMSLWVNPNNHALDGGRASSAMEKECIVELGEMFGWDAPLGHLTGGGTMANLEALWVAGRLQPGKRIVASEQAHYTHSRISEVLGLPFSPVPVAGDGRMDIESLKLLLRKGDVGTVVATIGNTGLGAVDPLAELVAMQSDYDFRIHADAAYGGYFVLASDLREATRRTYESLGAADSIVIDPHKHGLQPYGCGCVLFKDPSVGRFYHGFWKRLEDSDHFSPLMEPELDIVVYAVNAPDSRASSERARKLFAKAAEHELHLAMIELPVELVADYAPGISANSKTITCLRSVLMKPEQRDWLDQIVQILESSAVEID